MSYWKTGRIIQKGKYVIEKVLGAGGAGITYRAKDVEIGNVVAIKTLNATIQAQKNFAKHQERFIQEAFRLAKCTHAHVIRVDDVCQEGNLWCMVMEYIDGGNLETLVKRQGGFAEVEAIRYIYQVGSALTYIHKQGILHRDVKPANIMRRRENNEAVLIDFGLARDFIEDKTQIHTNSRTEGFAPLEQYSRNAKRGAYTDVYALAATLYYIVTLQIPFPAQFRNQGVNLISPQQHNSTISDRTNLAILKGMELHPENRPQSIDEWLNILTENIEIILSSSIPVVSSENSSSPTIPSSSTTSSPIKNTPATNLPIMAVPLLPTPRKVRKVKNTKNNLQTINDYDPLSPSRFENNPVNVFREKENTSIPELDSTVTEIMAQKTVIKPEKEVLASEVGIDYSHLEELLSNQEWYKADEQTHKLMLKASNKEDSGWIDRHTMRIFPCQDLQTIDQLWVKYSKGKFGFSIQKRIYQSLGGKRDYDKKVWETVGDRLGWRINGTWLFQDVLMYTVKAPVGHLPSVAMSGLLEKGIYTLMSRIMDCNIN